MSKNRIRRFGGFLFKLVSLLTQRVAKFGDFLTRGLYHRSNITNTGETYGNEKH